MHGLLIYSMLMVFYIIVSTLKKNIYICQPVIGGLRTIFNFTFDDWHCYNSHNYSGIYQCLNQTVITRANNVYGMHLYDNLLSSVCTSHMVTALPSRSVVAGLLEFANAWN